ncbi:MULTISPECIES: hypothetical protein [Gemmobacter]|jgi:hypothetical protein|uniref:Uncharacterized protein n=1 Tax=Gemmobacter nanjingensis TaxID=488454 RepID=A0ABQ3FSA5_9RHOB|nr:MULTISPECIES: hypothetical protein [Gemmobacter]GHC37631.1 hypothetical protein GCM10007291_44020 [Gemmobacter nanjingensis]
MAIDRAALFRLAWTWAKQDLWSVRAPASRLRAFFKVSLAQAWREMKRRAAARAAAIAPAANARPVEVVRAEIWAFECKDSIRGADWQTLAALKAELAAAELRAA